MLNSKLLLAGVVLAASMSVSACGSSSNASPTSPTSTATQTIITDVLTGTVPVPVGGVMQSTVSQFTVAQGGGSVSVTLTSAVESFPDGSFLPTVAVGLGVGTYANGTCTLLSGAFTPAQGGTVAQLSGTLAGGAYCVQVSDITSQVGPVSYAVAVTHP